MEEDDIVPKNKSRLEWEKIQIWLREQVPRSVFDFGQCCEEKWLVSADVERLHAKIEENCYELCKKIRDNEEYQQDR